MNHPSILESGVDHRLSHRSGHWALLYPIEDSGPQAHHQGGSVTSTKWRLSVSGLSL